MVVGSEILTREYRARLEGIVSGAFSGKTVLIVGVGGGSYLVEKLARLGPARLKVLDHDVVELQNLSRTNFAFSDAANRHYKVDALADRVRTVNPFVEVATYPLNITKMSQAGLDELFDGVDLVIAGTDTLKAQALINEVAVGKEIPALFIGVHEGAQGGRIIWFMPAMPCYRCVAKERFTRVEKEGIQSADLPGERGFLIDVQLIDMIAAKIAVAILDRGEDSAMGRFFEAMGTRNDVIVRCDPTYEWGNSIWKAVLASLTKAQLAELNREGLFAMDSVWLRGEQDPDCPVCGGKR